MTIDHQTPTDQDFIEAHQAAAPDDFFGEPDEDRRLLNKAVIRHDPELGWQIVPGEGQEPEPLQVTEDGYLVDAYGEVHGITETSAETDAPDNAESQEAAVQAYLRRRAWADAKLQGKRHEMNLLVAGIQERFETQIREQERKLEWLDRCFGSMAQQWATEKIAHQGKGKSIKTDWATLGFKANRESTKVTNQLAAMAWLLDDSKRENGDIIFEPLRLTFDLSLMTAGNGNRIAADIIAAVDELVNDNLAAVKVEVRPSLIPDSVDRATLPQDAFEFTAAGSKQEFYIEHGKGQDGSK